jgi:hypothetical protein
MHRLGDRSHRRQRLEPALRLARGVRLVAPAVDIGLQLLGLGLLLFAGRLGLDPALGPLPRERIVIAAIEREPAALQMQNVIDHGVEQVAFVTDHDETAAIAPQKRLEPHRGFEIEMVRRLVEQQQLGLGEQQRGERYPHTPAAGERVERLVLRLFRETEAGENARGPRRGAMGVDHREPFVNLADAVRIVGVLRLLKQFRPFGRGGEHRFERRG